MPVPLSTNACNSIFSARRSCAFKRYGRRQITYQQGTTRSLRKIPDRLQESEWPPPGVVSGFSLANLPDGISTTFSPAAIFPHRTLPIQQGLRHLVEIKKPTSASSPNARPYEFQCRGQRRRHERRCDHHPDFFQRAAVRSIGQPSAPRPPSPVLDPATATIRDFRQNKHPASLRDASPRNGAINFTAAIESSCWQICRWQDSDQTGHAMPPRSPSGQSNPTPRNFAP